MNIEQRALEFAIKAHEGQLRKYTNEPYIKHPITVANIIKTVNHSTDMICAALLHDVVEDTSYTIEDIQTHFGKDIAYLVLMLTDQCTLQDGNRAMRKAKEAERIARISNEAKTIKIADCIDNADSILKYDPDFALVYHSEIFNLLPKLIGGNSGLWLQLETIINDFEYARMER